MYCRVALIFLFLLRSTPSGLAFVLGSFLFFFCWSSSLFSLLIVWGRTRPYCSLFLSLPSLAYNLPYDGLCCIPGLQSQEPYMITLWSCLMSPQWNFRISIDLRIPKTLFLGPHRPFLHYQFLYTLYILNQTVYRLRGSQKLLFSSLSTLAMPDVLSHACSMT